LHHVVLYYGESVDDVIEQISPPLDDPIAKEALDFLAEDFEDMSSIGPLRAAEFLGRSDEAGYKADVAGAIRELLQKCDVKTL